VRKAAADCIKVGDLVRVLNDTDFLFGHGIVLEMLPCGTKVLVRWFDDWKDSVPIDEEKITTLVILSES
tara:strand:+ start:872 stop:1078 length:207 start_codon:yes stop_codon:yes gene_type:complete